MTTTPDYLPSTFVGPPHPSTVFKQLDRYLIGLYSWGILQPLDGENSEIYHKGMVFHAYNCLRTRSAVVWC